ncbi:MAG TPA: hypothetical protein VNQ73_07460 [Ilumatobacter sp.]|nr:hypothetical protein [Ilumatobacter sp.]
MTEITDAPEQLEQLTLPVLPAVVVPLQFRVSEATARRGMQHVAELRQMLANRQAAREQATRPTPVVRRNAA